MKIRTWSQSMRQLVVCLFLAHFASPATAVDKGVYEGTWSTGSPAMILAITNQDATFSIDGKTFTDPDPEYFYGQQGVFPFLYLQADETSADPTYEQNEHRFYLIIGETDDNTMSLRGYYDYSRIRKDHHGTVDSESYPIQMERMGSSPNIRIPPVKGQAKE